jgi:hypothetical protein
VGADAGRDAAVPQDSAPAARRCSGADRLELEVETSRGVEREEIAEATVAGGPAGDLEVRARTKKDRAFSLRGRVGGDAVLTMGGLQPARATLRLEGRSHAGFSARPMVEGQTETVDVRGRVRLCEGE